MRYVLRKYHRHQTRYYCNTDGAKPCKHNGTFAGIPVVTCGVAHVVARVAARVVALVISRVVKLVAMYVMITAAMPVVMLVEMLVATCMQRNVMVYCTAPTWSILLRLHGWLESSECKVQVYLVQGGDEDNAKPTWDVLKDPGRLLTGQLAGS